MSGKDLDEDCKSTARENQDQYTKVIFWPDFRAVACTWEQLAEVLLYGECKNFARDNEAQFIREIVLSYSKANGLSSDQLAEADLDAACIWSFLVIAAENPLMGMRTIMVPSPARTLGPKIW